MSVGAAAVINSRDSVHGASDLTLESLHKHVDDLKAQFDAIDAKNRKLIEIALGLAALSLGIDIRHSFKSLSDPRPPTVAHAGRHIDPFGLVK